MTRDDLAAVGRALHGERWQTALARDLQVSDRTVRRWLARDSAIPAQAESYLRSLLAARHSALGGMARMLPTPQTAPGGARQLREGFSPVAFAARNARTAAAVPLHGFMRGSVVIPPDVDLTAPVIDESFDVEVGDPPE